MFKYNELSDLVDGSLVTPLSKTDNGSIRCLDSNGKECFYYFKDFDFDKKIEERKLNSESLEDEVNTLIKDEPSKDLTYQDMLDEMEKDDSIIDGTDEPEDNPDNPDVPIEEHEEFCNEQEINNLFEQAKIKKKPNTKYVVWKDII